MSAKVYGNALGDAEFSAIISDVAAGYYRTCIWPPSSPPAPAIAWTSRETVSLTKAMIGVGDRIDWGRPLVVDKHCVGGPPGNRIDPCSVLHRTPGGLTMPKTSSRVINLAGRGRPTRWRCWRR